MSKKLTTGLICTIILLIILLLMQQITLSRSKEQISELTNRLEQYELESIKLENYPICDGAAKIYFGNILEDYEVACTQCSLNTGYYESYNEAAEDWNNIKR